MCSGRRLGLCEWSKEREQNRVQATRQTSTERRKIENIKEKEREIIWVTYEGYQISIQSAKLRS